MTDFEFFYLVVGPVALLVAGGVFLWWAVAAETR
jgi:hypothetical protein